MKERAINKPIGRKKYFEGPTNVFSIQFCICTCRLIPCLLLHLTEYLVHDPEVTHSGEKHEYSDPPTIGFFRVNGIMQHAHHILTFIRQFRSFVVDILYKLSFLDLRLANNGH